MDKNTINNNFNIKLNQMSSTSNGDSQLEMLNETKDKRYNQIKEHMSSQISGKLEEEEDREDKNIVSDNKLRSVSNGKRNNVLQNGD